jgi:flagellar capping protein FliD
VPTELAGASLQRLTDIGVTLQKDGKLNVDAAKLGKAIGDDLPALPTSFLPMARPSVLPPKD